MPLLVDGLGVCLAADALCRLPQVGQTVGDFPLLALLVGHVCRDPILIRFDQVHHFHRLRLAQEVPAPEDGHAGVVAPVVVDRHLLADNVRHVRVPEELVVQPHALRADHALDALGFEYRHRRPVRRIAARLLRHVIALIRRQPVLADVVLILGQQLLCKALGEGFKVHQLAALAQPAQDAPVVLRPFLRRIAAPSGELPHEVLQRAKGALHVLRPATIRQRMVYGDAQRPQQALLLVELRVQQPEVGLHEAVSLEALAPVVLAVVDVDCARQAVYVAARRIHRRPAEAVRHRVAVRLQRQLPAHELARAGVHPCRHPRAHQIAVFVEDEQIQLVVVAEPHLVDLVRLHALGLLHVGGLPCPLAPPCVGELRVRDCRHHPVDRVPVRRDDHVPLRHLANRVGIPLRGLERPSGARSVAVHAAVACVVAQLLCPLPQPLEHQRLGKLAIIPHLILDVVLRQLAHAARLALVLALHLVHDRRKAALFVSRMPAPQRPARYAVLFRQLVDGRRPLPVFSAVQDAVQRHHRLLALCQLRDALFSEGRLVRRQIGSAHRCGEAALAFVPQDSSFGIQTLKHLFYWNHVAEAMTSTALIGFQHFRFQPTSVYLALYGCLVHTQ